MTDSNGAFNITDIPGLNATIEEGMGGPGAGDMGGLFYSLSAVKYNDSGNTMGMYIGTSMPSIPESMLRSPTGLLNPAIHLKPAVTFWVQIVGYDYKSGPDNQSLCNESGCPDEAFNFTNIAYSYSLKDKNLGYPIAEDYNSMGYYNYISALYHANSVYA